MDREIVTIATTSSMTEAAAWKVYLESEGIRVFLADIETIKTDWFLANALGSVKLQVPRGQAERAAQLLEEKQQQKAEPSHRSEHDNLCLACDAEMADDMVTCPACGWTFALEDDENAEQHEDDSD